MKRKVHFANSQLISPQERAKLEKVVLDDVEKSKVEFELKSVQDKIEYYQHLDEQDKKTFAKLNKQKQIQFLTIGVILLVLAFYGLYTKQSILIVIGVLGGILIGVFLTKMSNIKMKSN